MSRRLLSILLALSVALNVSFVAGFLYVGRQLRALETSHGRAEWAARKLGLDGADREAFLSRHTGWRLELERIQRERKAERDAFWQEAVKDDADRGAIQARLVPLLAVQREATVSGVDHLLRLFGTLTLPQRQALVKMLRQKEEL
jgi:hypothetical protein